MIIIHHILTGVGDIIRTTMVHIIQDITMDITTDTIVDIGTIITETIIMEMVAITATVQPAQLCRLTDHRIVTQEHQPGKTIAQMIQDTEQVEHIPTEPSPVRLDLQQIMVHRV